MWQIILDAFLDTLKIFPFLLIIYILIELLENKTSFTRNHAILQGRLAPLLGTATGLIPQCGFSVMAAKLYDKGLIQTGTLLAVFIATSDEALIILLSSGAVNPQATASLMPLVLIKMLTGLAVGYLFNFLFSGEKLATIPEQEEVHGYSCGREHEGRGKVDLYLIEPLLHSLKISLYLFIVNLVFGFLIDAVGEETIASYFIGGVWFQPFITALIGLIPNCASSVLITQAYINDGILFGSCVAGLCSNAGLGFVVLLKNTKKLKRNILLIIALYLISVLVGVLTNGAMLLFGLI
jgi:hypothetical protein